MLDDLASTLHKSHAVLQPVAYFLLPIPSTGVT